MELYWLLRLPHLHDGLAGFAIFFGFMTIPAIGIIFLSYCDEDWADNYKKYRFVPYISMIICMVLSILCCLCPDKTDVALMLGWDAINSDSVQEVIEILKERIK